MMIGFSTGRPIQIVAETEQNPSPQQLQETSSTISDTWLTKMTAIARNAFATLASTVALVEDPVFQEDLRIALFAKASRILSEAIKHDSDHLKAEVEKYWINKFAFQQRELFQRLKLDFECNHPMIEDAEARFARWESKRKQSFYEGLTLSIHQSENGHISGSKPQVYTHPPRTKNFLDHFLILKVKTEFDLSGKFETPFSDLLNCLSSDTQHNQEAIQEVQAHYARWQSQRFEKTQKRLSNCRNECVELAMALVKVLNTELEMIPQEGNGIKQTEYLDKLTKDISRLGQVDDEMELSQIVDLIENGIVHLVVFDFRTDSQA